MNLIEKDYAFLSRRELVDLTTVGNRMLDLKTITTPNTIDLDIVKKYDRVFLKFYGFVGFILTGAGSDQEQGATQCYLSGHSTNGTDIGSIHFLPDELIPDVYIEFRPDVNINKMEYLMTPKINPAWMPSFYNDGITNYTLAGAYYLGVYALAMNKDINPERLFIQYDRPIY